jgi:hypothetical protein
MRNLHGSPYEPRPHPGPIEREGDDSSGPVPSRRSGNSLASIDGCCRRVLGFRDRDRVETGRNWGNRSLGSNLYGGRGTVGGDTSRLTPTKSDANERPSRSPAAPPRRVWKTRTTPALLSYATNGVLGQPEKTVCSDYAAERGKKRFVRIMLRRGGGSNKSIKNFGTRSRLTII